MNRYRHEYKYLLSAPQEAILRLKASAVLAPDAHALPGGSYLVRSVYLDDPENSCLQANLDGTDPRSKFRIRYYNSDPSRIQLEKKSKKRGMCLKEACPLLRGECEMLLAEGKIPPIREDMGKKKQQLLTELYLRQLKPVTIVTYERIPFVYTGGNVRVTFDRMLTSSGEIQKFLTGDYLQRPVFPLGQSLLEVKWDELLPRHIREVLQADLLQWTAFSKYYMCRMMYQSYQ